MNISDIKDRKKALKLTTKQLAYLAELPVSTVSKIMTGETKNPSYITIEKIENAIVKEEMLSRIKAYRDAYLKYCEGKDPSEGVDYKVFDCEYRKKNNLDDAPIPFAKKRNEVEHSLEGNLAKLTDYKMTYDMLEELGEDRYIELINGNLIIGQAPDLQHQIIVQNVGKIIDEYVSNKGGKCKVFSVGVNVFLEEDDYTMLIPDVVVCDDRKLNRKGIYGAPDFIIEVVSGSTRRLDYNDKMHRYMAAGTREYWIIDPMKDKVTVYIEGEPMMAYVYGFKDEIPVSIYNGELTICVADTID